MTPLMDHPNFRFVCVVVLIAFVVVIAGVLVEDAINAGGC